MIYLIHGWLCTSDPDNTEDPVRDPANNSKKFDKVNSTEVIRFEKKISPEVVSYVVGDDMFS